jgi:AcrR family transcriptional regulator
MQNAVPDEVALRSLSDRHATYASEVERLLRAGVEIMRRTQSINPKVSDVVHEAGLSNQAFYRHFRSKDDLLIAILDDGSRQLVDYLTHLMAKEARPIGKIRRWTEGVMAQAVNPVAADATRPFVVDSLRLANQYPEHAMRSEERLRAPLSEAIAEAAASLELSSTDPVRDAEVVYHLTFATMHGYLMRGEVPTHADVEHLVEFVLAGLARDARGPLAVSGRTAGRRRGA